MAENERQVAETARYKRRMRHQLMDLSLLFIGAGTSIGWLVQGHGREATLLAFVTYWGAPWGDCTDAH